MRNKIVTVKYGEKYSYKHVNNLYNMACKHCKSQFEFICITDDNNNLYNNIKTILINKDFDLESYWWKLCIFDDVFDSQDSIVFLDLDTFIQNSIDNLFTLALDNKITLPFNEDAPFNFYHDTNPLLKVSYINSSIMIFKGGQHKDVLIDFLKDVDANIVEFFGLDRFLSHRHFNRLNKLNADEYYYLHSSDSNKINFDKPVCLMKGYHVDLPVYKKMEEYFL